jgi:hypothetical protein
MAVGTAWIDCTECSPECNEGRAERERASQKNQPDSIISDGDWYYWEFFPWPRREGGNFPDQYRLTGNRAPDYLMSLSNRLSGFTWLKSDPFPFLQSFFP